MMEIIKKPIGVCGNCYAEFTFTNEDVKFTDGRHKPYVECPVCSTMLSLRNTEPRKSIFKRIFGT